MLNDQKRAEAITDIERIRDSMRFVNAALASGQDSRAISLLRTLAEDADELSHVLRIDASSAQSPSRSSTSI